MAEAVSKDGPSHTRMTNVAIGKGAAVGTAVFAGMFVASLIVLFALQALLGINVPA